MKKKNKKDFPQEKLKRVHRISINLNEKELRVFLRYCRKYRIKNKAQFIRELIFRKIFEDYDKDYPKLF